MSMNAAGKHGRRAWLRAMGAWGATGALGAWGVAASPAFASNWPVSPITFLQPYGPGTALDAVTRLAAKQIGDQWGVSIVVENRAGANGVVGTEAVARSKPDGSVFLFTGPGHFTNEFLIDKLPYDAARDFKPVARIASVMLVLVVPTSSPFKTAQELIAFAKANPGKLSYASAGNGSISHLATELLKTTAQIDMLHVPYKGGGAASADLLAGNVSLMIETITNAQTLVKTGKVRAIANSGSRRWPTAPDLPTFAEAGVPGYQVDSWTGLFIAAGTPKAIVDRLNSEVAKASRDPSYRQAMTQLGVEATSSTPEAFASFVRAEMAKWARVVQLTGTKVD
jgi:tripartite-type tricarboxylate transporter receptor subunit TctC